MRARTIRDFPSYESESDKVLRQLREQQEELRRRETEAINEAWNKQEADKLRKEIKRMGAEPCC